MKFKEFLCLSLFKQKSETQSLCISSGHFHFNSEKLNQNILMESGTSSQTQFLPDLLIPSLLQDESFGSKPKDQSSSAKVQNELGKSMMPLYMKFKMSLKQVQIVLIDNSLTKELLLDNSQSSNSEKFYVLTPLDVNLLIEKCIYQDADLLPDLKVVGELPMLDFKLTDSKLEKIVNLLISIPYPDAKDLSNMSMCFNLDLNIKTIFIAK